MAKKKLIIGNEHVRMIGKFHKQSSVLKGDTEGFCDGFELEISLDTKEPDEQIATLIRLSRQMCFTEKAPHGSTPVQVSQRINGQSVEV